MKIIRYQDAQGRIHYASEHADGTARRIDRDIFGRHVVTSDIVRPGRLLAPVVPTQILCIGLNYRRHAAESGAAVPERPVLFVKGINTLQNPGEPNRLGIMTRLNGQTVQSWNTDDMIFPVRDLIAFLSGSTTLPAGTVILTGTPHGVGMAQKPPRWLKAGDEVTIEIEGIGSLTNPVADEPQC